MIKSSDCKSGGGRTSAAELFLAMNQGRPERDWALSLPELIRGQDSGSGMSKQHSTYSSSEADTGSSSNT